MRHASTPVKLRCHRRTRSRLPRFELLEARALLAGNISNPFTFGSTSPGEDIITGLFVDDNGTRYVTGNFRNSMTFGTGDTAVTLTSNGGSDIYVIAFNADYSLKWATSYGGAGDEAGGGITVSGTSVVVSGTFQGSFDADPTAGTTNVDSQGANDILLTRFNTSGTFLWAKTIGGGGSDAAPRITSDAAGNFYLLGTYTGSTDLDPGAANITRNATSPGGDLFISKITAAGNLVWVNTYIYNDSLSIANIKLDNGGNIYFAGTVRGSADLDGTLNGNSTVSVGSMTAFVAKINNNGAILAASPFGTLSGGVNDNIVVNDLAVDTSGNIIVVGDFGGTIDVNPNGITNLSEGVSPFGLSGFIAKLSILSGNLSLAWAGALEGVSTADVYAVITDAGNNVYIAGDYANTVDFNIKAGTINLSSNTGQPTPFVAKYDAAGNFLWEVQGADTSGTNAATRMALFQGLPVVAGSFNNSITFPTSGGNSPFNPGTQENFIFDLAQTSLAPTINFTTSATTGVSGQTITITLSVTSSGLGVPTGNVFFKNGVNVVGLVGLNASGQAVLTLSNIAAGNYNFSAIYSGDTNFLPAATAITAVTITPNRAPIGRLDSIANNMLIGWAADLDSKNQPLFVQFWLDGRLYSTMSASNTRPDLQSVVGATNHGFFFQVPPLVAGAHSVRLITYDPLTHAGVVLGNTNIVSNSLYFDEAWYLRTYPDVAAAVAAKVYASGWQQFITIGAHQGRNPSPYFDETWYRAKYPDIKAAIAAGTLSSGFAHFVAAGSKQGRDPSPFFNEMFYRRAYPDIGAAVTSGAIVSGFTHFLISGLVEGRSPTPWFDAADYRARYADVNTAINNGTLRSAYDHFVTQGLSQKRRPGPFYIEADYLSLNPDIATAANSGAIASGLVHFIRVGFYEGRGSYAAFDATWYLSQYPAATVAINAGQAKNAFHYFLLFGRLQGNMPAP